MDPNGMTKKGRERAEHRTANSYASFHPGIARRFFQENEGADKWNEHRRADLEAEFFRNDEMPAFVQHDQEDESHRELPAPHHGVNADGEKHRTAGLQQDRQNKLYLGQEL